MSRENVEVVRAAYDAWNREDLRGFLELMDPAIVFQPAGIFPGHDAVYRGHHGMEKFWITFHEPWKRLEAEVCRLQDLHAAGVLALIRFDALGLSGVAVQRRIANLLLVAHGLIVAITAYAEWEEALEAVGLRE